MKSPKWVYELVNRPCGRQPVIPRSQRIVLMPQETPEQEWHKKMLNELSRFQRDFPTLAGRICDLTLEHGIEKVYAAINGYDEYDHEDRHDRLIELKHMLDLIFGPAQDDEDEGV